MGCRHRVSEDARLVRTWAYTFTTRAINVMRAHHAEKHALVEPARIVEKSLFHSTHKYVCMWPTSSSKDTPLHHERHVRQPIKTK